MSTNDTDFSEDGKLEYESPLLTKLKESPITFKEPDGYFEDFNRRLNERIKYEQPSIIPLKKEGVIRKLYNPYYAIAATLIIAVSVIGLKYIIEKPVKPPTQAEIAEVVTVEKVESMDEDVLIDAMDVEAVDEGAMMGEDEISDDVIIDYLLENNIDLDNINEL